MINVNLGVTASIVIVNQVTIDTNCVEKFTTNDNGSSVICFVGIVDPNNGTQNLQNITLWDDNSTPTYTQIGNWIDSDVDNRLIQLLTQTN